jgi:hypothetical protein
MEPSTVIQRPDPTASHGGDRRRLRAQLHGMWASVAPAWAEHADYADTRGADITASLLDWRHPAPASACSSWPVGPAASGSPLPEPARHQLRARLETAARPYQTPTGLDFPGVCLLAAARRPSPS